MGRGGKTPLPAHSESQNSHRSLATVCHSRRRRTGSNANPQDSYSCDTAPTPGSRTPTRILSTPETSPRAGNTLRGGNNPQTTSPGKILGCKHSTSHGA